MSQIAVALGIVLSAVVALRWLLRLSGLETRWNQARVPLRVLASCSLGARQRLHIVEVEGERLLVGATDGSVRLLRRLPASAKAPQAKLAEEEDPPRAPQRAARWLHRLRSARVLVALLSLLLVAGAAWAAPESASGGTALRLDLDGATQPEGISTTLEILGLLTLLSVAPSILLMATCFTRVIIVLALLRQAMGIQQLPPNQVLVGLALAITLVVMAPVGEKLQAEALDPYVQHEIDAGTAAERARGTVREFLLHYTREKDLALFVSLSHADPPEGPEDVSLATLLPSYMISELRTAFEIGFTIFLPFLILDLVIASMLISMQMIVLPPMLISLPFKIMLFVLLDGWNLVVGSLISGLS